MIILNKIESYSDDNGNTISSNLKLDQGIRIKFAGKNNRIIINDNVKLGNLSIDFACSDGLFEIGYHETYRPFIGSIRIGQDSRVILGDNVSTTGKCFITAAEGSEVIIGNDVMIAKEVEIKGDDAHPIFDVATERRINTSRGIRIGSHVWLAQRAAILDGSRIGDGCVVGFGSIVKGKFPNNCVIAGVPARIMRRNIAWERSHLCSRPYYKPDASAIEKSAYWNLTATETEIPSIMSGNAGPISARLERMMQVIRKKVQ